MSSASSRPAIAFILTVAVLDVMAMGLVIPVLPALIEGFAGSEAAAGYWTGIMVAIWAGMQFLCSPIIGSISDRFGRRPTILVSTAGLTLDWILMALAPDLWWLAVGRIIGGITSSSFTAVFAYMADITAPDQRARGYGLVGAAFSAGFIAGPLIGGVLGEISPRAPFWTAAALSGATFLYGLFILPESLPQERRMPFSWARANPFGALKLLHSHPELSGLAVVNFLLYFAHHVFSVVFVLYAAHKHGWTPIYLGFAFALAGILEMIAQAVLVGPAVKRWGDRRTMVAGLALGSLGLAGMGLAPTGLLFTLALFPNALWALAMPTLQSLMTRRVSESEQGQLQGANMSVGSIAGIASPLFFGWMYEMTVDDAPGISFVVAAGILAVGTLLAAFVSRRAAMAETT